MNKLASAMALLRYAGFSILPIGRNKTPSIPNLPLDLVTRRPSWNPLIDSPIEIPQIDRWIAGGALGVGVIGGVGNLAILDVESDLAWQRLDAMLPAHLRELVMQSSLVQTPSGGRHLYCVLESRPGTGRCLARDIAGEVLIEWRGDRQYVVAPGSSPLCHPTGRLYTWLRYCDEEERCIWPVSAWRELCELCLVLDESDIESASEPTPAPSQVGPPRVRVQQRTAQQDEDPGAHYSRVGDWRELLAGHGWTLVSEVNGVQRWRRPGKNEGASATVGHCHGSRGESQMFVFSTSAIPFESGKTYSLFAARAILSHAGDFSACARELRLAGYGSSTSSEPTTPEPEQVDTGRRYLLSSELRRVDPEQRWIVHGIVPAGGSVILSAHPKVGKTTLLAHMIRCLGTGEPFLGQAVKPTKCLVLSEEDEATLAERVSDLGLGDHVGWYVRQFPTRPTPAAWSEWIVQSVRDCLAFGAGVLVVDTLSRHLPMSDENSSTEIDNALAPLTMLLDAGVAIVLVHHLRKGSGDTGVTAARGSIAIQAWAEVLLNLSRGTDMPETARVLTCETRHSHGIGRVVIDMVDGEYVLSGEEQLAHEQARHVLADAMRSGEELTAAEWARRVSLRRALIESVLHAEMLVGRVAQSGDGSRGSAYRYRRVEVRDGA